ncbi:hypothetical protein LJR289_004706 [Pseudoduganella sp. LjRoot289]|uniref:hypothetical protein n=1 Tax=Pseudoduganella sp. LjRoot289 TaxID=3342314 RepID=UPI003ECF4B29
MRELLDGLAHAMNQLDHVGQEEFVGLISGALEEYPDLGWELGPDPLDANLLRLSLAVRNAPEFRERASASGSLPLAGEGWVIDIGVPPRAGDIYLEAQAGDEVLAIEGDLLGVQLRAFKDMVDLVLGVPPGPLRQLGQAELEELAEIFAMGELGELNMMDHVNSVSVEQIDGLSRDWPSLTTLRAAFAEDFPSCAYAEWLRDSRS